MADKDIAEMTKPELIREINETVHIRTRKPLAEFSREELVELLTWIRDCLDEHKSDRWYA